MQPFSYAEGTSPANAAGLFKANSEYLAGGTTLIDLMKLHVLTPSQLIDLSHLELKEIKDHGDQIEIGALVTNNDMAHHPLVKLNFPFVSEALLSGASVQLRNLATTSGNILQKTRCSYYRDLDAKCNKRNPGSGCDALQGYNRMHAIVGTSDHCIASHPSDLCVALTAADAEIKIANGTHERFVPITEFYTLPGITPQIENVLTPGEMILSVRIPKKAYFKHSVYVKIRDRSSYAFALTSAAVAIEIKDGLVKSANIAMGGIGTMPWRGSAAEKILVDKPLSESQMKLAAQAMTKDANPRHYNAYKIPLAEQTLIRALEEAKAKS